MSPSPIRRHQRLATILSSQIEYKMATAQDSFADREVVHDLDWIINDNTVLRPDIAIVCDRSGDFITTAPVLVIEILSPSTALRDKHVKHEMYQKQGVKYYIIADPPAKTFQSYISVNGLYQLDNSLLYAIHDGCSISIDIEKALAKIKG